MRNRKIATHANSRKPQKPLDIALFRERYEDLLARLDSRYPSIRFHAELELARHSRAPCFAESLLASPYIPDYRFCEHVLVARACLPRGDKLDNWQRDFLISIQKYRTLSPKQLAKLSEIATLVGLPWVGRSAA